MPQPIEYQLLAERRIRQAMEEGEFDGLAGTGRPVPGLDRPYDPAWWARAYLERRAAVDRAVELAAAIERRMGSVWALPGPAEVTAEVGRLNSLLEAANQGLPPGERVPLLDPEDVLATWRRMGAIRRARSRR